MNVFLRRSMPQVRLSAATKAEEDGGNYNNGVIGNKEILMYSSFVALAKLN